MKCVGGGGCSLTGSAPNQPLKVNLHASLQLCILCQHCSDRWREANNVNYEMGETFFKYLAISNIYLSLDLLQKYLLIHLFPI